MPQNCPNEYAMNQNPEFQSDRQQMGVCQLLARLSATTLTIQLTMYMTVGRGEHETGQNAVSYQCLHWSTRTSWHK